MAGKRIYMKGFSLMNWSEIQGYTVAQDIKFHLKVKILV